MCPGNVRSTYEVSPTWLLKHELNRDDPIVYANEEGGRPTGSQGMQGAGEIVFPGEENINQY